MNLLEKIANEINESDEDEWHVSKVRRLVYRDNPPPPPGGDDDDENTPPPPPRPKGKIPINMAPPPDEVDPPHGKKKNKDNKETHEFTNPPKKDKDKKDGGEGGGGGTNYKHHYAGERVTNVKTGKTGIIKKINPDGTVEIEEIDEAMKNLIGKMKG